MASGWVLLLVGFVSGLAGGLSLAEWRPADRSPTAAVPSAEVAPASPGIPPEAPTLGPPQSPMRPTVRPTVGFSEYAVPQDARLQRWPTAALPTPATPAWLRNAVAVPDPVGRPMIAVVIDDLGLNRGNAKRVTDLPGPLTLAFMTYAEDLERQTRAARAAGHELMVHFPMEPLDEGLESGPNALEVDLLPDELRRRLEWGLSRFDGYVGVNNHMGSRFTGWEAGMAIVLEEIGRRGLMFLDSRTTAATAAAEIAAGMGVPYAARDVFLDNETSAEAVRDQLAKTEAIARQQGAAIAIGHPHDGTIDALSDWLPTLAERGFVLVPVSAILRRKLETDGGPLRLSPGLEAGSAPRALPRTAADRPRRPESGDTP